MSDIVRQTEQLKKDCEELHKLSATLPFFPTELARKLTVECECEEGSVPFNVCEHCGGSNGEHQSIEILGDGENFENDVIGYKMCPVQKEEFENIWP